MATKTKYTIAILDEEKKERDKFLNFFEEDFNVVEIPYIGSVDALIELIKTDQIDAIAIDYNLKDHKSRFTENGDYFFKQLINRLQDFPSFVITQDSTRAKREAKLINPLYILDKEKISLPDGRDKRNFISEIITIIKNYRQELTKASNTVKKLEKIRKTKGLNKKEEDEYLKLNNFLAKSIVGASDIPLKFFSQETNKKLDEIIKKTDKLINKISKEKTDAKIPRKGSKTSSKS